MKIKEVRAKSILDSRRARTIEISVNGFKASAPSGKSKGTHEKRDYHKTLSGDISFINKLAKKKINLTVINRFEDLALIEPLIKNKIGANTLFALESAILKAAASEQKKPLWKFLNPNAGSGRIPLLLSNAIGGGAHSHNILKPDFQEFLVIGNKKTNTKADDELRSIIDAKGKNDENAWQTSFDEQLVVELLSYGKTGFGIDAAASQFYKAGKYYYKHPAIIRTRQEQIEYIIGLIKDYKIKYFEDPLQEEDFSGFAEILKRTRGKCIITGDDLTTTNLARVKKAVSMKAINGLIVKPNQIGSLIEVKKVIEFCRKHGIKIIVSHRSGETMDDVIADLAVAWHADYIKIPVSGKERLAKVDRLDKIKREI